MPTSVCIAMFLVQASVLHLTSEKAEGLRAGLQKSVQSYTISEPDFAKALIAVASRFEIPMGIEWLRPTQPQKLNLSWQNATAQQIILSIADTQPGYGVRTEQGIVHVFSKELVDDRSNFLNIRIEKFEMGNEFSTLGKRKLWNVLRGRFFLQRPAPSSESEFTDVVIPPGDKQMRLTLENSSVREILDTLALSGPCKIWIVTFSDNPRLTRAGFRPTASPGRGSAIPDNEQPTWECLSWGQKPYW